MKYIFILVLISLLSANAYAQKKMTARELEGLKGNVKSVLLEWTDLEINNKNSDSSAREFISEDFYDKYGNIKLNPNKPDIGDRVKFSYDEKGRIDEAITIDAKGDQLFKNKYRYNTNGQVSEKIDILADTIIVNYYYTYDAEGNLAEDKFVPTKESFAQYKFTRSFKDYKFDAQGNWIQCTVTENFFNDNESVKNVSIYYRTIKYYK